ncbi:hypothetical protein BC940DRAFT_366256 [Gongronella butleri]|nr:hypothetical protein BC940DRAFT_366256 [Gongronella butleri]
MNRNGQMHRYPPTEMRFGQAATVTVTTFMPPPATTTTTTWTTMVGPITSSVPATTPAAIGTVTTLAPGSSLVESVWLHRWLPLFPVLFTFAIIGLLALIALLATFCYLMHLRAQKRKRGSTLPVTSHDTHDASPARHDMANVSKYQELQQPHASTTPAMPFPMPMPVPQHQHAQHPTRQGPPSSSAAPTTPAMLLSPTATQVPSTFIPIETSPLTLVPRATIWRDPERRRGVDEVALWEYKQQHHHPHPSDPLDDNENAKNAKNDAVPGNRDTFDDIPLDDDALDGMAIPMAPSTSDVDDMRGHERTMDNNDDDEDDIDDDRPWKKYMQDKQQASSPHADAKDASRRSSSTILHSQDASVLLHEATSFHPVQHLAHDPEISSLLSDKEPQSSGHQAPMPWH